jgi:uncharacterized protein (DUF2147 family)
MKGLRAGLASLIIAVSAIGAGAAAAGDPMGTWVMSNGKVTVKVSKCSSKICARIVSLKEPLDKAGRPKVDRLNPNPALRKRPLIGLMLAFNMAPSGDDNWIGSIYNPDDGRTYSASMKLSGSTMQVKGCVAGILCRSNNFRRIN